MLLNARSLREKSKRITLEAFIEYEEIEVLIITETWWQEQFPSAILQLQNFTLAARCDRIAQSIRSPGGDVAIYVKKNINFHSVSINNIQNYSQIAGIRIKDLQIVGVYRKPCNNWALDKRTCDFIADKYTNDNIIIAGDTNLPYTDWKAQRFPSRPSRCWRDLCHQMSLEQIVEDPTHEKGNLLDCIFVKSSNRMITGKPEVDRDIFTNGFTDHYCVKACVRVVVKREVQEKEVLDEKNMDWEKYKEETKNYRVIPKVDRQEEANGKWNEINSCLVIARDTVGKKKVIKLGKSPVWMSHDLQKAMRKDQRLRKLTKQPSSERLKKRRISKWKFHHKGLQKRIKESRVNFEIKKVAEYKKDSKALFRDMKRARGGECKQLPVNSPDGAALVTNVEKAVAFQNRFLSVYTKPKEEEEEIIWTENWGLNDIEFSPNDIKKVIKDMKIDSSPGKDRIGAKYYKNADLSVVFALTDLYNHSMKNTDIPTDFLNSMVIPIWKNKGSISDISKYRQITMEITGFKIMIALITHRINAHLEENGMVDGWQHGFQKKKSTTTNLMTSWEYISKIVDDGGGIISISLDFSNAFDSLDLNQLMLALQSKGIGGKLGAFIEKWLKTRSQFVNIDGEKSHSAICGSGVAQGSHAAPTLFCILLSYIIGKIDLTPYEEEIDAKILSFADDTRILLQSSSLRHHQMAQTLLDTLNTEFKKAGLTLNASKSIEVIYGKNMLPYPFVIDGEEVEIKNQSLELGCLFTNNMSFKDQLERNVNKASGFVFTVMNTMKVRNFSTLKKLYMTYFVPILLYASQLFVGDYIYTREALYASFRQFWRLGNGQIIPGKKILDPYQIAIKNNLTFLFQILRGENCLEASQFVTQIGGITRSASNKMLLVPENKTRIRDSFFTTSTVKWYNELPLNIKESESTNIFKKRVTEHVQDAFKRIDFDYRPLRVRFGQY